MSGVLPPPFEFNHDPNGVINAIVINGETFKVTGSEIRATPSGVEYDLELAAAMEPWQEQLASVYLQGNGRLVIPRAAGKTIAAQAASAVVVPSGLAAGILGGVAKRAPGAFSKAAMAQAFNVPIELLGEGEEELGSGMELAFDTEPIVGWRGYRVEPFARRSAPPELRLVALTGRTVYEPKHRHEGVCIPSGTMPYNHGVTFHEAPWPDCMCGIWATRHRSDCENETLRGTQSSMVIGEVSLWGRVLEFELGWRAQYAYPKVLHGVHPAVTEPVAAELSRVYGVPVTPWIASTPEEVDDASLHFSKIALQQPGAGARAIAKGLASASQSMHGFVDAMEALGYAIEQSRLGMAASAQKAAKASQMPRITSAGLSSGPPFDKKRKKKL